MPGLRPTRRRLIAACAGAAARPAAAAFAADLVEWEAFKARFVQPDGRVTDTGNQGVSHTEGQGWGMLFAQYFADAAVFVRIWHWTAAALRRPGDALLSWRYVPGAVPPVADTNNATDGDLFVAMALARAARRWRRPDYAEAARAIGNDIGRLLLRRAAGRVVLLPGAVGFETAAGTTVNPSYYAIPALRELAACCPGPDWMAVQRDGLALIEAGRFGRWGLPPDWVLVPPHGTALIPAPGWPPRFSYDAIRVPLYLAWSRLETPALAAFRTYWTQAAEPPAWMDVATDTAAPYPAPSGMRAVGLLACAPGQDMPTGFPLVADAADYFSAALTLLARIAWRESRA